MLLIRIILVLLFVPAFVGITRSVGSRSKAFRSILLFVFIGLVALSILSPQLWEDAAQILGVNSGVDLLLYGTVLALMTHIAYSLGKFRLMEKRIATLVQELALLKSSHGS